MTTKFSPFVPPISRWQDDMERLSDLGLPAEEIELLRRATSGKRLEERKSAVKQAADYYLTQKGIEIHELWAWNYLLISIEINGIGGRGRAGVGLEGPDVPATDRHPAFCGLGKGRRHASDGEIWNAAIQANLGGAYIEPNRGEFYIEPPSFKDRFPPVDIPVVKAVQVLGREWVGTFLRAEVAKCLIRPDRYLLDFWTGLLIKWTQTPPDPEPPKEDEPPPSGEL